MKSCDSFIKESLKNKSYSSKIILEERPNSLSVLNNSERHYLIDKINNLLITYIVIENYINDYVLIAYSVESKSGRDINNYEYLFNKSETFNLNKSNEKNIIANDIKSWGGFYENN